MRKQLLNTFFVHYNFVLNKGLAYYCFHYRNAGSRREVWRAKAGIYTGQKGLSGKVSRYV